MIKTNGDKYLGEYEALLNHVVVSLLDQRNIFLKPFYPIIQIHSTFLFLEDSQSDPFLYVGSVYNT